ncbi:hypothetical protein PYW07_013266 [Mythimna separata]|uniref:Importin N-terminal domain-containing protein n=1 Tax=Mythimna separata TaxID=271217 RepID=A0AAD8DJD5_MYTSE|nr:hypothetical protein PYW07_013266 [Mythimna separata]
MAEEQEVIQIELLCKQLYESSDPLVREQAEKAVVGFQESPDTLSKCQALLERADSSYSQLLAATTLAKLISRSTASLSTQQRLDIRNYVLNYLAARPKLAPFVAQSLVSLFARITKLSWFDMIKEEYVFQNVINDITNFLRSQDQCTVGVQLLSQLVVEMNQVSEADANRSLAKHRKIASSFRDTQLFEMFRLSCSLLGTMRGKPLELASANQNALVSALLRLAHNCLTFDFIGTTSDESSDDLCTVQIPTSWRPTFLESGTLDLFFELYHLLNGSLASLALACLVQLASVRRSLFSSNERAKFLNRLAAGVLRILDNTQGLSDPTNYHEFCRLLARLKSNYQLGELVMVDSYPRLIELIAKFTVQSLQTAWSPWASRGLFFTPGWWVVVILERRNYHEFCRLLARLKSNYQLGELVMVDSYPRLIELIAKFTVQSLQMWQFAPNSVHYLLSLWQRMVASVPYVKASEPHLLETYAPGVTAAYIGSRLDSVSCVLRDGLEDPLDDVGTVQQQLEQLSVVGRCEYGKTCQLLVAHFDRAAAAYSVPQPQQIPMLQVAHFDRAAAAYSVPQPQQIPMLQGTSSVVRQDVPAASGALRPRRRRLQRAAASTDTDYGKTCQLLVAHFDRAAAAYSVPQPQQIPMLQGTSSVVRQDVPAASGALRPRRRRLQRAAASTDTDYGKTCQLLVAHFDRAAAAYSVPQPQQIPMLQGTSSVVRQDVPAASGALRPRRRRLQRAAASTDTDYGKTCQLLVAHFDRAAAAYSVPQPQQIPMLQGTSSVVRQDVPAASGALRPRRRRLQRAAASTDTDYGKTCQLLVAHFDRAAAAYSVPQPQQIPMLQGTSSVVRQDVPAASGALRPRRRRLQRAAASTDTDYGKTCQLLVAHFDRAAAAYSVPQPQQIPMLQGTSSVVRQDVPAASGALRPRRRRLQRAAASTDTDYGKTCQLLVAHFDRAAAAYSVPQPQQIPMLQGTSSVVRQDVPAASGALRPRRRRLQRAAASTDTDYGKTCQLLVAHFDRAAAAYSVPQPQQIPMLQGTSSVVRQDVPAASGALRPRRRRLQRAAASTDTDYGKTCQLLVAHFDRAAAAYSVPQPQQIPMLQGTSSVVRQDVPAASGALRPRRRRLQRAAASTDTDYGKTCQLLVAHFDRAAAAYSVPQPQQIPMLQGTSSVVRQDVPAASGALRPRRRRLQRAAASTDTDYGKTCQLLVAHFDRAAAAYSVPQPQQIPMLQGTSSVVRQDVPAASGALRPRRRRLQRAAASTDTDYGKTCQLLVAHFDRAAAAYSVPQPQQIPMLQGTSSVVRQDVPAASGALRPRRRRLQRAAASTDTDYGKTCQLLVAHFDRAAAAYSVPQPQQIPMLQGTSSVVRQDVPAASGALRPRRRRLQRAAASTDTDYGKTCQLLVAHFDRAAAAYSVPQPQQIPMLQGTSSVVRQDVPAASGALRPRRRRLQRAAASTDTDYGKTCQLLVAHFDRAAAAYSVPQPQQIPMLQGTSSVVRQDVPAASGALRPRRRRLQRAAASTDTDYGKTCQLLVAHFDRAAAAYSVPQPQQIPMLQGTSSVVRQDVPAASGALRPRRRRLQRAAASTDTDYGKTCQLLVAHFDRAAAAYSVPQPQQIPMLQGTSSVVRQDVPAASGALRPRRRRLQRAAASTDTDYGKTCQLLVAHFDRAAAAYSVPQPQQIPMLQGTSSVVRQDVPAASGALRPRRRRLQRAAASTDTDYGKTCQLLVAHFDRAAAAYSVPQPQQIPMLQGTSSVVRQDVPAASGALRPRRAAYSVPQPQQIPMLQVAHFDRAAAAYSVPQPQQIPMLQGTSSVVRQDVPAASGALRPRRRRLQRAAASTDTDYGKTCQLLVAHFDRAAAAYSVPQPQQIPMLQGTSSVVRQDVPAASGALRPRRRRLQRAAASTDTDYGKTCQLLVAHFDRAAAAYSVPQPQQIPMLQGQLTWLVYIIGAAIGGRASVNTCDENDAMDGELVCRVLQLMDLTDSRLAQNNKPEVLGQLGADHSEDPRAAERPQRRLLVRAQAGQAGRGAVHADAPHGECEDLSPPPLCEEQIIAKTLGLLSDLSGGYSCVRKLVKLDEVQFMLTHHTAEHFPFLGIAGVGAAEMRCRSMLYTALGRLLMVDLGEDEDRFLAFMMPLTAAFESIIGLLSGPESPMFSSEDAKKTLIGLARDLRGLAFAFNTKTTYMMLFDWIYPVYMKVLLRGIEVWFSEPALTTPVLKLTAELAQNRNQRLHFDVSSPNGILLFRELSNIICAYGSRILTIDVNKKQMYAMKLKGISLCFSILKCALCGNYANFGVFRLYGDEALDNALNMFVKLLLSIPQSDLLDYPKLSQTYYVLLERLAQDHMPFLANLQPDATLYILCSISEGLTALDTSVCTGCCATLDHIVTYLFKQLVQKSSNKVSNPRQPPPETSNMFIEVLQRRPEIMQQLLATVLNVIMFEDCCNQWSMSRPLLGLILLNEEQFSRIRQDMIAQQPRDKQAQLAHWFNGLMAGIEPNLLTKNRDRFTQNLSMFRRDINDLLKGAAGVSGGNASDMMTS